MRRRWGERDGQDRSLFRSLAPVVHGQRGKLSYAAWGEFLHGEERETRRRVASGPWYSDWDDAESGYMDEGLVRHAKFGFMLGYDIDGGGRIDVLGNSIPRSGRLSCYRTDSKSGLLLAASSGRRASPKPTAPITRP